MLDHSKIDLLKPKKAAWADTESGVENDSIKKEPEQGSSVEK